MPLPSTATISQRSLKCTSRRTRAAHHRLIDLALIERAQWPTACDYQNTGVGTQRQVAFLVSNTAKWQPIFDARQIFPVLSPWPNTARHKGFYEGPSRSEWPFRAIYNPIRHNERNCAMVVAGGGRAAGRVGGKTHAAGRCRRHRPMRHSMATRTTMTGTRYTRTPL